MARHQDRTRATWAGDPSGHQHSRSRTLPGMAWNHRSAGLSVRVLGPNLTL